MPSPKSWQRGGWGGGLLLLPSGLSPAQARLAVLAEQLLHLFQEVVVCWERVEGTRAGARHEGRGEKQVRESLSDKKQTAVAYEYTVAHKKLP